MAGSFQKAQRKRLKARIGLDGPSGSGKSLTAYRFASAIAKRYGLRIAVIDSENESALKYVGEVWDGIPIDFDICCLKSYSPTEYTAKIDEAGRAGFGVIVVDSLSHAWTGKDGALELVDKAGKNKFTDGWRTVTPMHNRMIESILASPAHIIVTMRSKTEYVIEENEKGQKVPRKVATAPIQRAGMEYEFDLYGSMDWSHVMTVTKSRCSAVADLVVVKPGASFMEPVLSWLDTGEAVAPTDAIRIQRVDDETLKELTKLVAAKGMKPEALKYELTRKFGIDRLAELTPDQAQNFMKTSLGGGRTTRRESSTSGQSPAVAQVNGNGDSERGNESESVPPSPAPAEIANTNGIPVQQILEEEMSKTTTEAKQDHGAQLDQPITKAMIAQVKRTIDRYVKSGGKLEMVIAGIRKRNPKATRVEELTWGQAADLEAAILKRLDGPHEEGGTPSQQTTSQQEESAAMAESKS